MRPTRTIDWLRRAEIRLFKTGHQFENRSLPSFSSSRFNLLLADNPEAGRGSLASPSAGETIQKNPRLPKAVTPQNQQQQLPRSNTEQRPPIARESFPVTSRSSKEPRAPKQSLRSHRRNTNQTTCSETQASEISEKTRVKPCGMQRSSANLYMNASNKYVFILTELEIDLNAEK